MKSTAILALLPFALQVLPTFAAPPGVMQYETIASKSTSCGGNDLFSIGFAPTNGTSCLSLGADATPDVSLFYFIAKCTLNVYSDASCDTLLLNVPAPGNPGVGDCIDIPEGFLSLDVICTP